MSTEDHSVTTKSACTAMEKHVQFWDRKNKGYITPVDTVFGFIHLGYGIVISITLGTFIGMLFSYTTQDSWIPDPLCRTRVEKWRKKNTSYQLYDQDGQLNLELFDQLFKKHAKSDPTGKSITIKELLEWNEATYRNPIAWSSTALEWLAVYLVVGKKGSVKKQDIQAVYDGTFFYQVCDRNKASRSIQSQGGDSSFFNISMSGAHAPKSYIQQMETQITKAIHTLPHSTVSQLETRLRHWLSFAQQRQVSTTHDNDNIVSGMKPILKGVATPNPIRLSPFSKSSNGDNETTHNSLNVDREDGLAGVMTTYGTDRSMILSGVQGYKLLADNGNNDTLFGSGSSLDDNETTMNDNLDINNYSSGESFSMAGVRSEDKEDTDWLPSGQLTGVTPSTSVVSNLADQYNNDSSNEEDSECTTCGKESAPLCDYQAEATPPLTDTGSVASDVDDMANNDLGDDNGNDLTKQPIVQHGSTDIQYSSNTDNQHSGNTDNQYSGNTDNQHNGNTDNQLSINTSKPSGGKKSKKNKKKKNRQQQTPSPTPTLPEKDYSVDSFTTQPHGQSLSCKIPSTFSFTVPTPQQHLMTQ